MSIVYQVKTSCFLSTHHKEGKTKNLIEHLEDIIAQKALVVTHGNMTRAAELISLNRGTLAKRNKRFLQKRAAA
ncbi:helix-turn-helix domain-containing protein [Acinetobacter haemolyticus]|uniref:helix-turn-helix domain-containing protein n=1 Tax=Acinetobacter haemolyticus TaxID=29430 RepID=UPI002B1BCFA3|nr:helix-turn-helix domain-containing protein [Acinetobacter haemolyticus]